VLRLLLYFSIVTAQQCRLVDQLYLHFR
jgi:hypothetical protein